MQCYQFQIGEENRANGILKSIKMSLSILIATNLKIIGEKNGEQMVYRKGSKNVTVNLPHQSLHCTIHFYQSSPTYLWLLSLVTRFYPFSPTTCSFYHWRSSFCQSIPWFYHEISIRFPHLFVHLLTRFHLFSPPPGSFNHWLSVVFSISSFSPRISSCSRPIAMCVLCIIFSSI